MQEIFPFDTMLIISSLAVFLLVGVILRATIPFFQKFLIPSCLIGGFIVMVLRNLQILDISHATLEILVYHLFNLSFISSNVRLICSPLSRSLNAYLPVFSSSSPMNTA